jgi:hypothetical protein
VRSVVKQYPSGVILRERDDHHFAPDRLADDEIAIATALERMTACAQGGPDVYSLAEAAQDRYIDILMEQALRNGQPVASEHQPWADG